MNFSKMAAMLIMVSCFATASYADTLASYSFEGTGFVNKDDHIANEYITAPADVQGSIDLTMDNPLLGQICWKVNIDIEGMDPMSFELKNNENGECYNPMISEELINLRSGNCWGGGCPEDETKVGLIGHSGFNVFFRLADLTGLITVDGSNNTSPEEEENPISLNYNFVGNVTLDLNQEDQ